MRVEHQLSTQKVESIIDIVAFTFAQITFGKRYEAISYLPARLSKLFLLVLVGNSFFLFLMAGGGAGELWIQNRSSVELATPPRKPPPPKTPIFYRNRNNNNNKHCSVKRLDRNSTNNTVPGYELIDPLSYLHSNLEILVQSKPPAWKHFLSVSGKCWSMPP